MANLSIAEAVRIIVSNSPCVTDCMERNLINYSALAREIYGKVLELTGKKRVSENAVKMALLRYGERLKASKEFFERRITKVIAESTLELKDDVAVIVVKQNALLGKSGELMKRIVSFRFFQLTQGTETFTIAVDKRSYSEVAKLIGKEGIIMSIEDQSAIILISPKNIIYVPGVISYITTMLARNNINITQIISCYMDTIFIVERGDASEAYRVLKEQIDSLRHRS